ncbi:carboxypeptidase regulatory-like domain-containing protein [Nibricoccus sp. IMCC34717]|uniref:carboxypeptidase regulatory-like domain-containing protein n=1 Tax=Nibricoccus sp. IMCC34717 TaxID=3034021 RepID=UPI00384E5A11
MSAAPGSRKVAVEITLDGEVRSATAVGSRTVYHYWNLLVSHYRGVLLPPQRRTDGQSVAWTWAQSADASAPGADELRALRRRLSEAHRHFVDAVSEGLTGAPISAEDAEELRARMGRIVAHLVSLPEREVLGYIGSTHQGWQFHSWGALEPGTETYPDDQVLSIRGRVKQGEAGVPGAEVSLEDVDGRTVDETRSDSGGLYAFYKLKPGSYRVKAASSRVKFALEGIPVELKDAPVSDADVVAEDPAEKVDVGEPVGSRAPVQAAAGGANENSSTGAGRWVLALLLGLLLVGAAIRFFFLRDSGDASSAQTAQAGARRNGVPETHAARNAPEGPAREVASEGVPRAGGGGVGRDSTWSNSERKRTTQGRLSSAQLEEFDSSKRGRVGSTTGGTPLRPQAPGTEGGLPGEPEGEPKDDALAPDAGGHSPSPSPGPAGTGKRKPRDATKPAGAKTAQAPHSGSPPTSPNATAETPEPPPGSPAAKEQAAQKPKPKAKPRTPPGTGGQPASATGATSADAPGETPLTTVDRDEETPPATDTEAEHPHTPAKAAAARSSRASTGATATDSAPAAPEQAEEQSTYTSAPATPAPEAKQGEERWLPLLLVSTRRWAPRFTEDRILATEPMPEGADDGAALLHATEWASVRQRLPAGFTAASVRGGVRFIVRDPTARLPLRWEVARGVTGAAASTSGARADIAWTGGAPLASVSWDLRDASGAVWARLRTTAAGEFSASRRDGVELRLWAEVDWRPAPGAREPVWRVDADERLPDGWAPVEAATQRIEASVEAVEAAPRPRIEILDTNSGWALASEWRVRPAREAGVNP